MRWKVTAARIICRALTVPRDELHVVVEITIPQRMMPPPDGAGSAQRRCWRSQSGAATGGDTRTLDVFRAGLPQPKVGSRDAPAEVNDGLPRNAWRRCRLRQPGCGPTDRRSLAYPREAEEPSSLTLTSRRSGWLPGSCALAPVRSSLLCGRRCSLSRASRISPLQFICTDSRAALRMLSRGVAAQTCPSEWTYGVH